jgi:proteasome lid subunit RPN8/RPN11
VVIPAAVRSAIAEHARAELPNEACGLLVLRDGTALEYRPGVNEDASPYRFRLRPGSPDDVFLVDEGFELAVVHSHTSSPPRPSQTDVALSHVWPGLPWVIYSVRLDELAAWSVTPDGYEPLAVS